MSSGNIFYLVRLVVSIASSYLIIQFISKTEMMQAKLWLVYLMSRRF